MPQDEHTSNLIAEAASHQVVRYLEERQARRRIATLTSLGFLISFAVGISGFLVNELLSIRVKSEVSSAIDNLLVPVKISGEIARLSGQIVAVTSGSLTPDTAKLMVKNLENIKGYINHPALEAQERNRAKEEIMPIVEASSAKLAAAGQIELLEILENRFQEYFKTSGKITQMMVQVRGRQLIGQAGAPENWFDSRKEPSLTYSRYQAYANRAAKTEYSEMYLAFELILRHMRGRPERELLELIGDAKSLRSRDKNFFVHLMVQHAVNRIAKRKTARTNRIAKKFNSFLKEFSEKDNFIKSIYLTVMQQKRK